MIKIITFFSLIPYNERGREADVDIPTKEGGDSQCEAIGSNSDDRSA